MIPEAYITTLDSIGSVTADIEVVVVVYVQPFWNKTQYVACLSRGLHNRNVLVLRCKSGSVLTAGLLA